MKKLICLLFCVVLMTFSQLVYALSDSHGPGIIVQQGTIENSVNIFADVQITATIACPVPALEIFVKDSISTEINALHYDSVVDLSKRATIGYKYDYCSNTSLIKADYTLIEPKSITGNRKFPLQEHMFHYSHNARNTKAVHSNAGSSGGLPYLI